MSEYQQEKNKADSKQMYPKLRDLMLRGSRPGFSLSPTASPTEPWGIVMDWGVQNGTATVMAMSDGSASVYLSSGGGYIGGKGIDGVRLSAHRALEVARSVDVPDQPTSDFPLPETRGVFFHFLTNAGVFVLRTSEQELNSAVHPLRKLGDAMQDVITQFRLWQAGTKSKINQRNPSRKPS